ncbi:TetR/AcrR family transcriptional regulator [Acidovorax sp. HDW3]|uniref:TetR/AcrR family transcriptional regulator n=1 Tax=Acidovorax sp. HDW3 TaxID=2714923 RepID=UPI00140C074C|nr:TetR/AcrR family transcriptional regulator [Acidovorax sp. HDW3]QIL45127.1 TetR/AcrR family transcriptional regulator [Acidovorax sp. HDW3]
MPRTRNESLHQERRQDILQAAARVFKAKGFHLARTEDICTEAGMSAGTLFRHFPDKRAMIMAIAEIEFEHYKRELEQLATRDGIRWLARITPQELREVLQPQGFELGTDSWLELARDSEGRQRWVAFDRRLRESLAQELLRGQKNGWVRPALNCVGAANMILALFSGLLFDAEMGIDIDFQANASALADLVSCFIFP